MTNPAAFWDSVAPKYARRPISNMPSYEAGMAITRTHLRPTDRVLELGCGSGDTARLLAPHVAHITASDISGAMLAVGRSRAQGMDNISFVQTDARGSDLPGEQDVVLAYNLLHLVPDVPATLRHVHDLLKPGGRFISKTPCLTNPFIRLLVAALRLVGKAPAVEFFDLPTLQAMIRAAGFEIVETAIHPSSPRNPVIVAVRPEATA